MHLTSRNHKTGMIFAYNYLGYNFDTQQEGNMSVVNAIKDVIFWLVVFPLVVAVAAIVGTLQVLLDIGR